MPFDLLADGDEPNGGNFRAPIFSMQLFFQNNHAIGTTGRLFGDWNDFWAERENSLQEQADFFSFEPSIDRMLSQCDSNSCLIVYEDNNRTLLECLSESKIRLLDIPEHLTFVMNIPYDNLPHPE